LSKPMTRWAFVSSKLVAQVVVYLSGFLIALVGAYFYTLVLFGSLNLGKFFLLNGLLFCWLLPFVSLTLAASVVGGSTGAAAGAALAASVLLLLLGNIPGYGQLTPGALIGWASQLFAGGTGSVQSNVGGLVSSLVVLILGLVTGIAVFEQQEL
jgi:ABC-2 type transport system permease protein